LPALVASRRSAGVFLGYGGGRTNVQSNSGLSPTNPLAYATCYTSVGTCRIRTGDWGPDGSFGVGRSSSVPGAAEGHWSVNGLPSVNVGQFHCSFRHVASEPRCVGHGRTAHLLVPLCFGGGRCVFFSLSCQDEIEWNPRDAGPAPCSRQRPPRLYGIRICCTCACWMGRSESMG